MSSIAINNLSMIYGSKVLFTQANVHLQEGRRYGITGANGAGKSTLLRLMCGQETAAEGEIFIPKKARIGWLKQDQFKYEHDAILDVVLQGNQTLWQALSERSKLLRLPTCDEATGYRLGELEEIISHENGYSAEPFAAELLIGLGIKEKYHCESLSTLSGGFKLRVLLAQALFNNPDILLLDEPTNHLDIMTIWWLENYLKRRFKGTLVFISHDQNFLNNLATDILDIDYGEITQYTGNYDASIQQKTAITEQKMHEKKHIERKIAQMRIFVERFRASATKSRQALAREKQIEKIEIPEVEQSSRRAPIFSFAQKRPSGKTVLTINKLSKKFNETIVFRPISFCVNRGERLLIIGHNGVGKSTLLKIICGKIAQDTGTYQWGHETSRSYVAQDPHELLQKPVTVYEWLMEQAEKESSSRIRSVLGNVLFSQGEVEKNVLVLSGGEAARLLLAKVMLEQANVLILDEPTNHLDIESRQALATALTKYDGTVILVTHDRHFAHAVATRVIAITESGIKDFQGTYAEYLEECGEDYLNRSWLTSSS